MSLYITISINEKKLETYYAHCIKINKDNIGTYEVGKYGRDNKIRPPVSNITHKRDLGAAVLAWMTIKEVWERENMCPYCKEIFKPGQTLTSNIAEQTVHLHCEEDDGSSHDNSNTFSNRVGI